MIDMQKPIQNSPVWRISDEMAMADSDWLAVEEPMLIRAKWMDVTETINISVTMRTPGHDRELAAGFLFTEGIIDSPEQVQEVIQLPETPNEVVVYITGIHKQDLSMHQRNFYTSSSCGVCGKSSIESIKVKSIYPVRHETRIEEKLVRELPALLRESQQVFQSTGGLHGCGLFTDKGELLLLREDVGRHNALDKLIGAALLDKKLPLDDTVLMLSGRASFELLQKAAMAGIPIVASVGAPSSLAVQMAEDSGISLCGFVKADRMNVYTGKDRIVL